MGYGSYTSADWSKLKDSRKLSSASNDIFSSAFDPKYDPKYIEMRESRESEEHPESTPIIIGLDDTASMQYLSEKIAKESLNETMMKLYSTNAVPNPQLMFAFYGDKGDSHPLQITQFESDIRIAEQLLSLSFENRGQGDVVNNALWYFASRHTDTDKWKKHGEKGFLFTIGDEAPVRDTLSLVFLRENFKDPCRDNLLTEDIIKEVSEKYELFHIEVIKGQYQYILEEKKKNPWNYLSGRVAVMSADQIDLIPEIIISTIQICGGKEPQDVLSQWDDEKREAVGSIIGQFSVFGKHEAVKRWFFGLFGK